MPPRAPTRRRTLLLAASAIGTAAAFIDCESQESGFHGFIQQDFDSGAEDGGVLGRFPQDAYLGDSVSFGDGGNVTDAADADATDAGIDALDDGG